MLSNKNAVARGIVRGFHALLTVSVTMSLFLTDTGRHTQYHDNTLILFIFRGPKYCDEYVCLSECPLA